MITAEKNTICAISTAHGIAGIAVIRLSGNHAIAICDTVFRAKNITQKLADQNGYTVKYGTFINNQNEEEIDDVLVTVFRPPHSFTGEEMVEISCHGSLYVQQQILQQLLKNGCTLAKPGEFTLRAFQNGKMDLSQAEAVADLIASTSASSHRMAMNQMRGGFSTELQNLRTQLLDFVSLVELELDFVEEDVEFADRAKLYALAETIEKHIRRLADSFHVGNVLKQGVPVALVGETNVGKSTLLNTLLNEEKAIVSDIHGTTRDVIEDLVNIQGITFRFIDTAGIRKTTDTIENMGIERTYHKIEQSEIVLWIIDCTQVSVHIEWLTEKISKRAEGKKIILVFNKIDQLTADEKEVIGERFEGFDAERIYISAKQRINTDALEQALVEASQLKSVNTADIIVNNIRHYDSLVKAKESILRVLDELRNNVSVDFLSQDLRICMQHLGEITGQITNDDVLENIFGKFCIGK